MKKKKESEKHFLESWPFSIPIYFFDGVSHVGRKIYRSFVPQKDKTSRKIALKNMRKLAESLKNRADLDRRMQAHAKDIASKVFNGFLDKVEEVKGIRVEREKEIKKKNNLVQRLQTYGDYFEDFNTIKQAKKSMLFKLALEYDKKGIIPGPKETLDDFVHRANALLFLHKQMREHRYEPEIRIDKETFDVSAHLSALAKLVTKEDIAEANKKILYYMDMSWVAAFIKPMRDMKVPAYGLCYTLPQYNGFNFIQVLPEYKTRDQFLKTLAHEMTHMGTVYLDTLHDFVETKAYSVGSGRMGEYVVAINKSPNFFYKVAKWAVETYFFIPVPWFVEQSIPKILGGVKIWENTTTFRGARKNLKKVYGDKGNYILGRLSAPEVEEFCYTNDIGARISGKHDLKWNIMKTNFASLMRN